MVYNIWFLNLQSLMMMSIILVWNVRGAGRKGFTKSINEVVINNKVDILAILEPRIS